MSNETWDWCYSEAGLYEVLWSHLKSRDLRWGSFRWGFVVRLQTNATSDKNGELHLQPLSDCCAMGFVIDGESTLCSDCLGPFVHGGFDWEEISLSDNWVTYYANDPTNSDLVEFYTPMYDSHYEAIIAVNEMATVLAVVLEDFNKLNSTNS